MFPDWNAVVLIDYECAKCWLFYRRDYSLKQKNVRMFFTTDKFGESKNSFQVNGSILPHKFSQWF